MPQTRKSIERKYLLGNPPKAATDEEIKMYLNAYLSDFHGKAAPSGKALDLCVYQVRHFEAVIIKIYKLNL